MGRTQELLFFFREIKDRGLVPSNPDFPIVVDSPLAVEATRIYASDLSGYLDQEAGTLIRQGIDCVALTSGGEAQVLRKVVETSPEGMALISSTPIACFGPYTAKCAKSEGLPVDIISDRYHSFTEFAAYLKDHLSWV